MTGRSQQPLRLACLALLTTAHACAAPLQPTASPLQAPPPAATAASAEASDRVYSAAEQAFVDFGVMAAELARADVIFFGEHHGDRGTHRLQRDVLEALSRQRSDVILALEMFERDVQPALDAYLADRITEDEFLARARPWPGYATDYRPLVEFARTRGWPVIAGNVPRPLAAQVAGGGLAALDALPPEERTWAADTLHCPRAGDYYERFVALMRNHPPADGVDASALADRMYEAQCVKDETMAESIARALLARPGALVVHMNGAFHSDFGQGAVAGTERRLPGREVRTLTALPLSAAAPADAEREAGRADYLLFPRP